MLRIFCVKALDLFLRKSGLYRTFFTGTRFGHPAGTPVRLQVYAVPAGGIYAGTMTGGRALFFCENRAVRDFKYEAQSDKLFWKARWKRFDPKNYWEIARGWQWLPAYLGAGDRQTRDLILDDIEKWLEENPYPNGLAWAVNLDVAVRAVNLLLLCILSEDERFVAPLWQHRMYIRKRLWLSKYSMRNNHFLGELAVLSILDRFFGLDEQYKYDKELENEFYGQFYGDGTNFEQSMRYHAFSVQFALLAKLFLGLDLPFLEQALDFVLMMRKPDGTWPSFGDDDMGCVFRLNAEPMTKDYDALIGFMGLMYRDGRAKYVMDTLPPEPRLFIANAQSKWDILEKAKPQLSKVFPDGGFWVTRTGWNKEASWFMVKFGPHKWHAHADIFHIELSIGGKPVLVDSGTYRYNNVPDERRYFRSTAAHNCMVFGDTDQSRQLTTFRWGKTAKVTDWKVKETERGFTFYGSHDGYACKGLKYRREVDGRNNLKELSITDTLDGRANGETAIYWHFYPAINLIETEGIYKIFSDNDFIGIFKYSSNCQAKAEIIETPYSAHYGHLSKKKTIVVKAYKKRLKPLIIESRFTFGFDGEHEPI